MPSANPGSIVLKLKPGTLQKLPGFFYAHVQIRIRFRISNHQSIRRLARRINQRAMRADKSIGASWICRVGRAIAPPGNLTAELRATRNLTVSIKKLTGTIAPV